MDIAASLAAAKGVMWVVFAIFVLLLFGKELRPLVDAFIKAIVNFINSV